MNRFLLLRVLFRIGTSLRLLRVRRAAAFVVPIAVVVYLLLVLWNGLAPDLAASGAALFVAALYVIVGASFAFSSRTKVPSDRPKLQPGHVPALVSAAAACVLFICASTAAVSAAVAAVIGEPELARALVLMAGFAVLFATIAVVLIVPYAIGYLAWTHRRQVQSELKRIFALAEAEVQSDFRALGRVGR